MITNAVNKTVISIAVGIFVSAPAYAVDYDVFLGTDTVVLAEEIFGITADANGQANLTFVTMPDVDINLDNNTAIGAGIGDGDIFDDGGTATIQFILGGNAQWGEDVSTTQLMACSNDGIGALYGEVWNDDTGLSATVGLIEATSCDGTDNTGGVPGQMFYEVIQGGAPADNTVTIRFTNDDGTGDRLVLDDITFGGVAVNNLTDQLSSASGHAVMFSTEYNEQDEALDDDNTDASENDDPVMIFSSTNSITFTIDALLQDEIRRIAVASDQKLFTNVIPGTTDFDGSNDVDFNALGSIQAGITTIAAGNIDSSGPQTVIGTPIKGEDGLDFEYAGGDTHAMQITGGNFNAYATAGGDIRLVDSASGPGAAASTTTATNCNVGAAGTVDTATAALSSGASATVVGATDGTGTADFALQGNTVALTNEYDLCVVADGTTDIDEEGLILNVIYTVDYFNARYDSVQTTAGPLGPIQRNGCIASFFNIPPSTSGDIAVVRLTNTSDGSTGGVTGTLYAQDGTEIASDFDLLAGGELAPHETGVFWTGADDSPTSQGRTLYSIEDAAGIVNADAAATYVGRARLVASGAFPICEALGMMRTGGGSLFNMSATTQGNHLKNGTINDRGNNGN